MVTRQYNQKQHLNTILASLWVGISLMFIL